MKNLKNICFIVFSVIITGCATISQDAKKIAQEIFSPKTSYELSDKGFVGRYQVVDSRNNNSFPIYEIEVLSKNGVGGVLIKGKNRENKDYSREIKLQQCNSGEDRADTVKGGEGAKKYMHCGIVPENYKWPVFAIYEEAEGKVIKDQRMFGKFEPMSINEGYSAYIKLDIGYSPYLSLRKL